MARRGSNSNKTAAAAMTCMNAGPRVELRSDFVEHLLHAREVLQIFRTIDVLPIAFGCTVDFRVAFPVELPKGLFL